MSEKEIRELITRWQNENYDVIISIPKSAGINGDLEAICFFPAVMERMMEAENPLRITSAAPGGKGLKAFVYGETYKMKANPEYLKKFVCMSMQFGEVQDILATNYT